MRWNSVPRPPAFSTVPVETALEDAEYTYDVSVQDSDLNEVFTLRAITLPAWLAFTDHGDGTGTLTGTPQNEDVAPGYDEADHAVLIEVEDWAGETVQQDFVITVTGENDAPDTNDDAADTMEDRASVIQVLLNDADIDGNLVPATVVISQPPAHGSAQVDTAAGAVTYTPAQDFNGTDSFKYQVSDDGTPGPVLASEATVVVRVDPRNDAPVAVDDTAVVDEDGTVVIAVLGNDSDVDGNLDAEITLVTRQPEHGTAVVDSATGEIEYTPDPDFNGVDTFEYRAFDDGTPLPALADTAEVTVTVRPVNDAPVAEDDAVTLNEDEPAVIAVLSNDEDTDSGSSFDLAALAVVTPPAHGTAEVDPASGNITYTPAAGYNGPDSFEYSIYDDGLDNGTALAPLSATAEVQLTVTPVNDPPVALDDSATTAEDVPVAVAVLANDTETDIDSALVPSTVAVDTPPQHGSVSIDSVTGTLTYTPAADYNGADSFVYAVSDRRHGQWDHTGAGHFDGHRDGHHYRGERPAGLGGGRTANE